MLIAIASDHAALGLKAELRGYLVDFGHEVIDLGPETADRVDYPDYGYKLAALRCALVSEPLSAAFGSGRHTSRVGKLTAPSFWGERTLNLINWRQIWPFSP